jgi:hypothetical protein
LPGKTKTPSRGRTHRHKYKYAQSDLFRDLEWDTNPQLGFDRHHPDPETVDAIFKK